MSGAREPGMPQRADHREQRGIDPKRILIKARSVDKKNDAVRSLKSYLPTSDL